MGKDLPPLDLTLQQQRALLDMASKKLGVGREELERAVGGGRMDDLQKHAGPELARALSDPKTLEALLSTPQAQAALKKLMKGG